MMSPNHRHCLAGKAFEMLPRYVNHKCQACCLRAEDAFEQMVSELQGGGGSGTAVGGSAYRLSQDRGGASLRASWW